MPVPGAMVNTARSPQVSHPVKPYTLLEQRELLQVTVALEQLISPPRRRASLLDAPLVPPFLRTGIEGYSREKGVFSTLAGDVDESAKITSAMLEHH